MANLLRKNFWRWHLRSSILQAKSFWNNVLKRKPRRTQSPEPVFTFVQSWTLSPIQATKSCGGMDDLRIFLSTFHNCKNLRLRWDFLYHWVLGVPDHCKAGRITFRTRHRVEIAPLPRQSGRKCFFFITNYSATLTGFDVTLPKFNSSLLKVTFPIGKVGLQPAFFRSKLAVKLWGCNHWS